MHLARQVLALHFLHLLQMIGQHREPRRPLADLALQPIAFSSKQPPLRLTGCVQLFCLPQIQNERE